MDSRESVISALKALSNQPCLTALANAGEYKRACKELQSGEPQIAFADGKFTVALGGETVTLGIKSDTFRCTCPSPVVCRHILAAVMAVASRCESDETEERDGAHVSEFTQEEIRSAVGERIFRAALKHYASAQAEIVATEPLTALVNGHKTVFLSGIGGESVCSCKKGMCEHRAIALLKAWSLQTGEAVAARFDPPDGNTLKLIDDCLSLMAGLLERGLYAATAVDAQLLMFYSLNLSKYARPLGKNLRSLSLLLGEVLENNLFTENGRLTYHFCKAYNLLSAVFRNAENPDILARILEDDTEQYGAVAEGSFLSLGCYPFFTESGYAGVTHMLAGEEGVCSLSSVVPTVYNDYDDEEIVHLVKHQLPEIFASLAGHRVTLTDFKSNGTRLNLTEKSSVRDGGLAVDGIPDLDVYDYNFGALAQSGMARDYFAVRAMQDTVVPYDMLEAKLGDRGFVEAKLTFGGRSLTALMDLNAVTRAACERLTAEKRKDGFAVLESYDGAYYLRSLFEGGRAVDLYFPAENQGKDGKRQ